MNKFSVPTKHEVKNKVNLGNQNFRAAVELTPENDIERKAIQNAKEAENTSAEPKILDEYILFSIFKEDYSVIKLFEQNGSSFVIDISMN